MPNHSRRIVSKNTEKYKKAVCRSSRNPELEFNENFQQEVSKLGQDRDARIHLVVTEAGFLPTVLPSPPAVT